MRFPNVNPANPAEPEKKMKQSGSPRLQRFKCFHLVFQDLLVGQGLPRCLWVLKAQEVQFQVVLEVPFDLKVLWGQSPHWDLGPPSVPEVPEEI